MNHTDTAQKIVKDTNKVSTTISNTISNTNQRDCVSTTCPYCGVGCGVNVTVKQGIATSLTGNENHPANLGRLCIKGTNLLATNDHSGRLLAPLIHNEISAWPEAVSFVAEKFNQIIAEHGPEAVAFYVSGQLLTEDYYVANKLMKGYIGSANIDTNSRLCMSSAVDGYKRAFGEDIVPCNYDDLEHTELVVLVGSNAAWTHPVLFQRIERAKSLHPAMKVIIIDPRRTASAELADLHLPLKPGSDGALFNGLLHFLHQHGGIDSEYVQNHTNDFDSCISSVKHWSLDNVAEFCQVDQALILSFYQTFLASKTAISFYSMGINQSSSGVDKVNAIINCHLASGKIGKIGCGPFSITGQPNAMGGREVGGLANTLAAHMDINNAAHRDIVQTFWQSPTIATQPGYKAVDLFDKIAEGKVKAVWIMATNPVVSLPNRTKIEQALSQCDFVVVSDCAASNDTLAFADVKFPATSWSEKDGTVTNSERRISRQRGFMQAPGNAKHDWQILCDVAKAMGHHQGFNFTHPSEIFDEHTQLTACHNNGSRALDLSGLSGLSLDAYNQLKPIQWPVNKAYPAGCRNILADGKFYTFNGKANFIAIAPALPQLAVCEKYPLSLTSGRLRDQWHTMTRTGKSNILTAHSTGPQVTVHPVTAKKLRLIQGDFVKVSSISGSIYLSVNIHDSVLIQQVFVPIHWNKEFASSASVATLFSSIVDPLSGQPELKHVPVALEKITIKQYALIHSPVAFNNIAAMLPTTCHWVKHQAENSVVYTMLSEQLHDNLIGIIKENLNVSLTADLQSVDPTEKHTTPTEHIWLSYSNSESTHLSAMKNQRFVAFAFFSAKPLAINDQWINDIIEHQHISKEQINAVLHGKFSQSKGRKICSCHSIYEQEIIDSIQIDGITSVEGLGKKLKCGTQCGSCKTDLACILREQSIKVLAEAV